MAVPALRRLPIRGRLALWYTILLLATIGAVGVFVLALLDESLERQIDEALRLRASRIDREIIAGDDERLTAADVAAGLLELAPLEEFSAPGIYVQILGDEGSVLASSPNLPRGQLPVTPEMIAGALAGREAYADVPAGSEQVRVLARPVTSGERVVGAMLVGQSRRLLDVTLGRVQQLLAVAAGGAALAGLVGVWWLTARALGPIAEVTRVARQIATTGQFERRIAAPPARDELGELAATFNDMLARLERTFRRQREFLADASHELRGPLMVIRGNLDLLNMELPENERRESVGEAIEEVERMSRLASDLLFLAEVEARQVVEQEPVALDDVVADVWERAKGLDAGSHELLLARSDPTTVRGDRERLEQLLWNLVENALRYTPAGGRVTVSLRADGQVAELAVADTGVGVPPEHLPRIFDRFYRVDPARSRKQGSTGLGLAIVRQVAEAHGSRVRVHSKPGEGTTFTVVLPLHPTPPSPDAGVADAISDRDGQR